MSYYITADMHGSFYNIINFCDSIKTTKDDIMIICGDAGINYYQDKRDKKLKIQLSKLAMTFFCVHGNHEVRPSNISSYKIGIFKGGQVWYQEDYPNILFAKDGEVYQFGDKKVIVIGGAYSVDKHHRLSNGWKWFEDEQPSDEIKSTVESKLDNIGWKVDYVLSHTCPIKYEPREWFLDFINQNTVDKSTEVWLGNIEYSLEYKKWYVGHFHGKKSIDKIEFIYNDIELLLK